MSRPKTAKVELRKYILQHAHTPWGDIKVMKSEQGDNAALLAAQWLIREQFGDKYLI